MTERDAPLSDEPRTEDESQSDIAVLREGDSESTEAAGWEPEQWAAHESDAAVAEADRDEQAYGESDPENPVDVVEDEIGLVEAELEAAALGEADLDEVVDGEPAEAIRRMDRFGPDSGVLTITALIVASASAAAVGYLVHEVAFAPVSLAALAAVLSFISGAFVYFLCRSDFARAWERRSRVLDAAAADLLEHPGGRAEGPGVSSEMFEETVGGIEARLRLQQDEREEKIRDQTLRELERVRVFFESMFEKHVFRINRSLREREAEVEVLRAREGVSSAEDEKAAEERDQQLAAVRKQLKELEDELDQVDRDRREKEAALVALRHRHTEETASWEARVEELAHGSAASDSELERLQGEIDRLRAQVDKEEAPVGSDLERLTVLLKDRVVAVAQLASELEGTDESESEDTPLSRSLGQLKTLVERLGDLGKVMGSPVAVVPSNVDVRRLVRGRVNAARPAADAADIKLTVRAPKDLPRVRTDRRLFERALDELVHNAVTCTASGGRVSVRAQVARGDVGESPTLVVRVHDDGPGVCPDDRERIFEPFEQVSVEGRRAFSDCVGLGLTLARGFVRQLGGEVEIDTKSGEGCTFLLRLPISDSRS